MAPPRKDVHENAPTEVIKRRTPISGITTLEPSCLRQYLASILVILAKCFQVEADSEQMKPALFEIGIRMLPVMKNEQNWEHCTLFEFFILKLDKLEAYRTEIMTMMVDKVAKLELPKKWFNMRVICPELRDRTQLLGDEIMDVLGIKNLLDNVPYSVALFSLTLYSTIVTTNSKLYRASYVAKFHDSENYPFDIIQTPDFEQFLQFLIPMCHVAARTVEQIIERIENETEELVSLQRLSADGLRRRDNINSLLDNLHRRVERETKRKEDQVVLPPAPVKMPQNKETSPPEPFQLLSRYVNVRNEDITPQFYSMVNRQTGIESSEIEKFFEHLQLARVMMACESDSQSAEEYSTLYG